MYKNIYKYLGLLTLLWTYSGYNMQAANMEEEDDIDPIQTSDCFFGRTRTNKNGIAKEIRNGLCRILACERREEESASQKKKAVMVFGVPDICLQSIKNNSQKKYNGVSFLSLEELTLNLKEGDGEPPDMKDRIIDEWKDYLYKEHGFMHNTFCGDDYTQYFVEKSYYLPRIYCPKKQGDETELPIYILVPSLPRLVQGIFFENTLNSNFTMPTERNEKMKCRSRLEACVELLNQYMTEVYSLVDIKALVINYECPPIGDAGSEMNVETHKLEAVDMLIQRFGTLLYEKKEDKSYSINPQVFWLNWYDNKTFKKKEFKDISNEVLFYSSIGAMWFFYIEADIHIYRQISLLYPFAKAHFPEVTISATEREKQKEDQVCKADCVASLSKTVENSLYMPVASLAQKGKKQMFLLNIDGILSSSERTQQQIEHEEKQSEVKEKSQRKDAMEEKKDFDDMKKYLTMVINNVNLSSISHERIAIERAIRYRYSLLYSKTGFDHKMKENMKKLLCMQNDTPAMKKDKLVEMKKKELIEKEKKKKKKKKREKKKGKEKEDYRLLEYYIEEDGVMKSYRFRDGNDEKILRKLKRHHLKIWYGLNKAYSDRLGIIYDINHNPFQYIISVLLSVVFVFYICCVKRMSYKNSDKKVLPGSKPKEENSREAQKVSPSKVAVDTHDTSKTQASNDDTDKKVLPRPKPKEENSKETQKISPSKVTVDNHDTSKTQVSETQASNDETSVHDDTDNTGQKISANEGNHQLQYGLKKYLNSFLGYFFFFGVLLILLIGLYLRWKRKK